jgi:hypothetical protein
MRPNFLVIGAQKCATSTLCDLLALQKDVFMCTPKEPHFFSDDSVWAHGLAWYEALFAGAGACQCVGEGSTTYSMCTVYPAAAERIAEHLPGVRVIYIVRHPLRRIESHWLHLRVHGSRGRGPETRAFDAVLLARPELVENTLYARQLDVYRRLLGNDRVLVLFYEDLMADKEAVLAQCMRFLGLDPRQLNIPQDEIRNNISAAKRPDNRLGLLLRKVPLLHRWRARSPVWLRMALRWAIKRRQDDRPQWSPEMRRWVLAQLDEDNRRFLRDAGKPENFWGLGHGGSS